MLSARSEATRRRTYTRPMDAEGSKFETWEQVIQRSHYDHHYKLWSDAGGKPDLTELKELYELGMSAEGLVAGRTLWLGGTEYAYSRAASQFNCSGLRIETVYDMVDAFWLLLNGCGVGGRPKAGTLHGYSRAIRDFQVVPSNQSKDYRGHEENREVLPTADNGYTWRIVVGDSATAWAKALGKLLASPRSRTDALVIDFSNVRGKGGRLKGYGWICNGYEPFAKAMTATHTILNRNAGNLLGEEDIGDIFNWCGTVLSSRRAAESMMIDADHPHAPEFARRKKDYWLNGNEQRRQSNNSMLFWRCPSVADIADLLHLNLVGGEPGFVNAEAALRRCPWFDIFNPCLTGDTLVATADGRNAVRIDQLAEESGGVNRFDVYSARPTKGGRHGGKWKTEISSAVAIMTGIKKVGRLTLSTGDSLRCTADHRIALSDGTYLEASKTVGREVEDFFTKKHKAHRRMINTETNGYGRQCRMMWERVNGPKPEGYEIDHVESDGGDFIDNLQLLTVEEHRVKSAEEKRGENNPMHRVKDKKSFRLRRSALSFGAGNPRHSGLTDEYIIELATVLHRDGIPINIRNLRSLDSKVPQSFSKNRFGGSVENLRKIASGEVEYTAPVSPVAYGREEVVEARQSVTVVSWEPQGEEEVYDLIVEKNRNFYVITSGDEGDNYLDSKGVLVHNCFEIMLPSSGFCNLVSLCLPMFGRDFARLERAVKVMARANYRQTCVNLTDDILQPRWHQTNEALRLCGVSFTGVAQAGWLSDYQIRRLRNAAISGAYSMADELGMPYPKAVTTIKPEGTRSKISGHIGTEVKEGIHQSLGRYVFNWINFSVDDPLVGGLEAAGYKTLPNPNDSNNVLVRFPLDFGSDPTFVQDQRGAWVCRESAVDQLRRYRRWNTLWADHNCSATVSFDESEIPDMARWIHRNWGNSYIATAFQARVDPSKTAADLGHPYLPQEVVTGQQYHEVNDGLRAVEWDRYHHGIHELDEAGCANGVCPTK